MLGNTLMPSSARFDERLCASEKIIYSEFFTMKVCSETNAHFALLYHVSVQSISKWISNLEKYGYISIHYENGKRIITALERLKNDG